MSPPLKVERLTPNGEIYTADLLTGIAKRLRTLAGPEFDANAGRPGLRGMPCGEGGNRAIQLKSYADQLDALAKALEPSPWTPVEFRNLLLSVAASAIWATP